MKLYIALVQVEAGTSTDVVKDASVEAEAPALGFQEDTTADPLKATEAPVEATNATAEGAAGEGAESAAKPIYLAGPWAATGCSLCLGCDVEFDWIRRDKELLISEWVQQIDQDVEVKNVGHLFVRQGLYKS